ncbi:hypothetical protein JYU34_021426 [Plutella xylostella]|uniref:HTH psq-type domain-containing protein n=1 Tax=Plutella xylostella TaxID=51655 RepID=A0ABQ7PTM0_PLUXY|nr:hypothetical protein JYU34_021426 [Plutella xylostella]
MPRVRVRKTLRAQIDLLQYKNAYEEVKAGYSLRTAAEKHGVNHCSLLRYVRKRDASGGEENQDMGYKALVVACYSSFNIVTENVRLRLIKVIVKFIKTLKTVIKVIVKFIKTLKTDVKML